PLVHRLAKRASWYLPWVRSESLLVEFWPCLNSRISLARLSNPQSNFLKIFRPARQSCEGCLTKRNSSPVAQRLPEESVFLIDLQSGGWICLMACAEASRTIERLSLFCKSRRAGRAGLATDPNRPS